MFKSKKLAVLAALLSLLMLVSLMAVPAFAEDAADATAEVTETVTKEDAEETTTADSKADENKKEETTTSAEDAQEAKDRMISGIINLSVGGVILFVLVILAIKFRAKIPGWLKSLKSECGKITWCPKDKLKKNVIVVVVVIVAIAVIIGVLDYVFSFSMNELRELVAKLGK